MHSFERTYRDSLSGRPTSGSPGSITGVKRARTDAPGVAPASQLGLSLGEPTMTAAMTSPSFAGAALVFQPASTVAEENTDALSFQLCTQWGVNGPAVLEVTSDVLLLVDGTTFSILVGNANLEWFMKILGAGNLEVGRLIMKQHVVSQLSTMGTSTIGTYEAVIVGVDRRHFVRGNVSAREPTRIVWCLQGAASGQHVSGAEWPHQRTMPTFPSMLDRSKPEPKDAAESEEALPSMNTVTKHPAKLDVRPVAQLEGKRGAPEEKQVLPSMDKFSSWHMPMPIANESPPNSKGASPSPDLGNGLSLLAQSCIQEFQPQPPRATQPSSLTSSFQWKQVEKNSKSQDTAQSEILCAELKHTAQTPQQSLWELKHTEHAPKGTFQKSRRPYRFCSMCWLQKTEWVLRSVTLPHGPSKSLNGHTNGACPLWDKGAGMTPEQNRAYATAFKSAQRRHQLYQIAQAEYELLCPDMTREQIKSFRVIDQTSSDRSGIN